MDGLDHGVGAELALDIKPLGQWARVTHRLVEALGKGDAVDPLASLREASLEQRHLLAKKELVFRVVAEECVGHIMVRTDAWPWIRQLENWLEALLEAVLEVGHVTILSTYSQVLAQGSESWTRLPATWYSSLRYWCSRRSSRSTSEGRMRNRRHSGEAMTLDGLIFSSRIAWSR